MPMKISLALGPRQPLSRQTAWGCLTTNLAMPGFGSLLAGRVSGYPQAALMLIGLILTVVCGIRFIAWRLDHWSQIQDSQADPLANLMVMWLEVRWALLGVGIFGFGWLWALFTSLGILREARKNESAGVPPRLR